ncbi:MAG TPA: hypothetical protein VEC13_01130 [Candidatus Paceibacterota bacterium]|nr:hypothetical protein [Candidatus Paceibacterota bacterium]
MSESSEFKPVQVKTKKVPYDDPDSFFEVKYDGWRGLVEYEGKTCSITSKRGLHLSFKGLERELAQKFRKHTVVVDGEIVSKDEEGRPIFMQLVRRSGPISFVAFDILFLDGVDLRDKPFRERRRILKRFARGKFEVSVGVRGRGKELYQKMVEMDLEGIVAKRLDSKYGPKTAWYKIKNPDYSQEKERKKVFRRKRRA